jgi:hypothetical protein
MAQLGFFDADKRLEALSAKGDLPEAINHLVPWESSRAEIEAVVLTPDEFKGTSNNVRGHKFGLGPVFDCLPGFFFRPLLRLEHCRRLHRLHATASRSSVTRRRML